MHERGFDEITVQAICTKAGVGRSTFYAHFQDKDELFIRHTLVAGLEMGSRLDWNETNASYRFPARALFEHVRQMKPVFASLARAGKKEFIMKVWQNNLAEAFEQRVRAVRRHREAGQDIPAVLLAHQLAGTLITLIAWWTDHHHPLPAAVLDDHFHRLISGLR